MCDSNYNKYKLLIEKKVIDNILTRSTIYTT